MGHIVKLPFRRPPHHSYRHVVCYVYLSCLLVSFLIGRACAVLSDCCV